MATEVEFDVFERDVDTERQTESLFKTSGEARRKTEVNVRRLDKESNQLFDRAKSDEKDHWISNGVGRTCDRAGIPLERIVSMRKICTWEPLGRMVMVLDVPKHDWRYGFFLILTLPRYDLKRRRSLMWDFRLCSKLVLLIIGICTRVMLKKLHSCKVVTKLVEVPHLNPA